MHYIINTFVSFSDCKLITVLSRKRSSLNCFSQVKLQRETVMTIMKHCFLSLNRDQVKDLRELGVGKGLRTSFTGENGFGPNGKKIGGAAPPFEAVWMHHPLPLIII